MNRATGRTLLLLASLLTARDALATACTAEGIRWARIGSHGELLVGGTFGVSRSVDGGRHWAEQNMSDAMGALLLNSRNGPMRIGDDLYLIDNGKILRTTRFDTDFRPFATVPPAGSTDRFSLGDDPRNVTRDERGRLFVCTADQRHLAWYDPTRRAWSESGARGAGEVACTTALARNQVLYAFSADSVTSSISGGWTWSRMPLPAMDAETATLYRRHVVDAAGTLYTTVETPGGVRIASSRDRGRHWTTRRFAGLDDSDGGDQVPVAAQGADLYVVTGSNLYGPRPLISGLYRVQADGAPVTTLLRLPAGTEFLLNNIDVTENGNIVLAADGSVAAGLLVSRDRGATWTSILAKALVNKDWVWCNGGDIR